MDQAAIIPWYAALEGLLAIGVFAVIIGAVSSSIRELAGGYWILGWAALLITGALFLAEDVGFVGAGRLAFVTDALFPSLMLMGALELHTDRRTPRWPLFVAVIAGIVRVGLDSADLQVAHAIHGATVAPAFFAAAAVATFRAPRDASFRVPIGILLSALVGFEMLDAWNDWVQQENIILWRVLVALCVPLAACQIASRLMALRAGVVSAEAASDVAERELDFERWRFEAVFDQVRELVAELTPETRILFVNERVRDMLGLDPAEVIGKVAIDFVPDELRFEAEEHWRRLVKSVRHTEPVVFPMPNHEGRTLFLEITVADYAFPGETRFLVIARDVTERRRAEQQVEEQQRELEERVAERTEQLTASLTRLRDQERLAAVGTLASGIAHQINNPVGAISAAAEYALLEEEGPEAYAVQRQALSRILEEARRAGRIVKSVLRFARHGKTTKWREDLGSVVRRSAELVRPYVEERGGQLEIDLSPETMPLLMSPIELEQMVVNLIRNAAESRTGGAHVRLSTHVEGEDAVLEVSDDGRGISTDAKSQIFNPFFTTRLREGGSGLGLSVVHGIVTEHGGEIEIDTGVDQGTCVRIRFPLHVLDGEPPARES